jgi:hypothetical protein
MTKFSTAFTSATKALKSSPLDKGVATNGTFAPKYLDLGEHEVTVAGIDLNDLDKNRVRVKWKDAKGLEHNEMIFLLDQNKKTGEMEWNWKFSNFVGGLIPNVEAYEAFKNEIAAANERVFDLLIGMNQKILLKYQRGYGRTESTEDHQFVVRCTQSNDVVGGPAQSMKEACDQAEAKGYNKAYVKAFKFFALNAEANVTHFRNGLVALHQPKQPAAFPFKKLAGGSVPY